MADGMRASPKIVRTTSSLRSRSTCAKRRLPISTPAKNASTMSTTGIWLGEVRPSGSALAKTRRTPRPLQVSHDRHQPAPATHWFAGVAQFQTGRRTPKDATLLSHRSVPPSVLVESCETQLYQRAQNDAQLLFSTNGVFRVQFKSFAKKR